MREHPGPGPHLRERWDLTDATRAPSARNPVAPAQSVLSSEDAEEYTQALGQVAAGAWRQIALGERLGVPKALKMTTREWVEQRLGGYIRLTVEERRRAVAELDGEGMGPRAIGRVLGVDHSTVIADQRGGNPPSASEVPPSDQQEPVGAGGNSPPENDGRVVLSERASQQRIDDARELNDQHPDLAAKVLAGDMEPKRAQRLARERAAEQRRTQPVEALLVQGDIETRLGDFRTELATLTLATVDAIITDPPYPTEFIPLYGDLSKFAAQVLAPNGVLAVMTGQLHLPEYIAQLGQHVRWRWCGAYVATGTHTRIHPAHVASAWKPILIFQQPAAPEPPWFLDYFTSNAGDKEHHHWGQSESGMASLVERLTKPGQLIVDPFLGAGTTAVVCRDLGRRFIGCDIDPAAVQTARERLQ